MRRWLQGILLIISVILISIAIYSLMGMFGDYRKEHDMHEHLKRIHEQEREPTEPEGDGRAEKASEDTAETEEVIVIDEGLLALHGENPDCIYWIRIPDTQIDYPVMYHPQEKDYYLKKDFYGEYAYAGSIYLSDYCDPEESDNLILYGHHMNNGSMFASLANYKQEGYLEQHPVLYYYTPDQVYMLQVFACFVTGGDSDVYAFNFATRDQFQEFINRMYSRSNFDSGVQVTSSDHIMTLSTCSYEYDDARYVVLCKIVPM